MLIVVATIRAKPGKEAEVQALLQGLSSPTHQEPGCHLYALHRSLEDPRKFVFVEKWAGEAELSAHLNSPHIVSAMVRQEDLLDSIDISRLVTLPGGSVSKGQI
jgi:quinol monooxygenase YgiN